MSYQLLFFLNPSTFLIISNNNIITALDTPLIIIKNIDSMIVS